MSKPMRVLQVVGGLNFGGVEVLLMNIYRHIDHQRIQFDFVKHNSYSQVFDEEIKQMGGKLYSCPRFRVYNVVSYVKWWNQFFKIHPEYKIIHGHIYSSAAIYLYVAKRYGLYTIAHSHISGGEEFKGLVRQLKSFSPKPFIQYIFNSAQGLFKKLIAFPIRYVADDCLACSQIAGEWVFGKNTAFQLMHNAIDTSKFAYNLVIRQEMRKKLEIGNNLLIGNVGRLATQKNQGFLLKMFAEIYKQNPKARLVLVGDGPLREDLIKQTQTLGISQAVIFSDGQVPSANYYQAMDVFVFPSLYEGLGIVLIEAQTAGLPCIISDNLPAEADLQCGLVTRVSLKQSPQYWAKQVLTQVGKPRQNQQSAAQAKGYDVAQLAKWLQDFYTKEVLRV